MDAYVPVSEKKLFMGADGNFYFETAETFREIQKKLKKDIEELGALVEDSDSADDVVDDVSGVRMKQFLGEYYGRRTTREKKRTSTLEKTFTAKLDEYARTASYPYHETMPNHRWTKVVPSTSSKTDDDVVEVERPGVKRYMLNDAWCDGVQNWDEERDSASDLHFYLEHGPRKFY